MTWDSIKLNDALVPGNWVTGEKPTEQVEQALSVGFSHVDTAQAYRNEQEAGIAIRESGLARKEVFITTKYSGTNGRNIENSIRDSLGNLGVSYVNLYLIHHPRIAVPSISIAWEQFEGLKGAGVAKSIGVSNFGVEDLKTLLASAKIKPAVNQILLHPYVYERQKPILEFAKEHGIVIEAYSALSPLTTSPGGPLDKPLKKIADSKGVAPEQILLAWTKAKGAVVVTTSAKKKRLEGYLDAGDIKLSDEEIKAIDDAGARGAAQIRVKEIGRRLAWVGLLGVLAVGFSFVSGVDLF
ncbi:hypothetical protein H1R20_g3994, partial [Candolleomyces eurysporus]